MNRFKERQKKHIQIDLFILAIVNVIFWISIANINVIEFLYSFNKTHDDYRLDIIIPLLFIIMLSFIFYLSRRLIFSKSYFLKVEDQSKRDELTGLLNRKAIESKISRELLRFERYKEVFCILIVDIDNFSNINEAHGRGHGDVVLQNIASRLQANTRKVDICCRWGGEQFIILCPVTELNKAMIIAEKLRLKIQEPMQDGEIVTASFGIMDMKVDIHSDDIVKIAEVALYKAKTKGKNRICVA